MRRSGIDRGSSASQRYQYPKLLLLVALVISPFVSLQISLFSLGTVEVATSDTQNVSADSTYVLGGPGSTHVCASIGGSWDNNSYTCTLTSDFSLSPAETMKVEYGASLVIFTNVTFTNGGTTYNYGTIKALYGAGLGNNEMINNNGTIEAEYSFGNSAQGIIDNNGTLIINNSDHASNYGIINNNSDGHIDFYQRDFNCVDASPNPEDCPFTNYGIISNNGTITNSGIVVGNACPWDRPPGEIVNSRLILNRGIFNNGKCASIFMDYSSVQQTHGHIENYATINNYGVITSQDHGPVTNTTLTGLNNENGTINNYDGGFIQFFTGGVLNNYYGYVTDYGNGAIRNYFGTVNNSFGTITINDSDGVFDNGWAVNNHGVFNNRGNINNYKVITIGGFTDASKGAIENYAEGTVDNNGTINNNWIIGTWGTFRNGGTINNNGTIYRDSAGNFTNYNRGRVNDYGVIRDCDVSLLIISGSYGDELSNDCITDFILNASPLVLQVHQGSSASTTITLSTSPLSRHAFTGNATLSTPAAYLLFGITASFSNTVVSSSRTSTLTMNVPSSVASFRYPIQVVGTSGSQNSSVFVELLVLPAESKPAPAFSLVIESQDAVSGEVRTRVSVPISVTIMIASNFNGTVNLLVSSPSSLSCSLDRSTVVVHDSSLQSNISPPTVNLTCSGATAGDFMVIVTAVSDGAPGDRQIGVTVRVASPPLTLPGGSILRLALLYWTLGGTVTLVIVGVAVALRRRKK